MILYIASRESFGLRHAASPARHAVSPVVQALRRQQALRRRSHAKGAAAASPGFRGLFDGRGAVDARLQALEAGGGDRQHVVVQDVVDVGADRRQHVDADGCCGWRAGSSHPPRDRRSAPTSSRAPSASSPAPSSSPRRRQRPARPACRRPASATAREIRPSRRTFLFRLYACDAHDRTMHHAAGAELRRAQAALTRVAGALLAIRLLGGARHLAHALGLVRAGAALGQLPVHHARHDVGARRGGENLVRQVGAAGGAVCRAW